MRSTPHLQTLAGGLLVGMCALAVPESLLAANLPKKPNVLMIFADDLNCRLGAYGDATAKSPNCDGLARAGVRFDRAYSANPVCMPSRTAILTGLRPETTRTPNNSAGCFRQYVPDAVTLPQLFARNGYTVASTGKTFFSHGSDDPETVKIMAELGPALPATPPPIYVDRMLAEEKERKAISEMLGKRQTYWGPLSLADDDMPDGKTAQIAVKYLREKPKAPFFLAVGFLRPHLPFVVPKPYFDLHPLESLPVPPESAAHLERTQDVEIGLKQAVNGMERERQTGRLNIGPDLRRRITQAYDASVSFMDAQVGKVLQALKEAGLEKDTIVVFASDNGFLLGEHGCWAKSWLYEESVRIPLLIVAPGATKPGSVVTPPVEFIDIYPTLADLCGLKVPAGLEGVSLLPLIKDPRRVWDKPAFSSDMCEEKMVRTEKWKLILFPEATQVQSGGLLFDMTNDPRENKNLYGSAQHFPVVTELRNLFPKGH